LYEQPDDKHGCANTEKSKDDDCRLYRAQNNASIAYSFYQIFLKSAGN
jgi:hypothetical protein